MVQVAFAGNDDYNALDATPLQTVMARGGAFTLPWNPYKEGIEYRAGDAGAIGEAEIGETGATVEYEVVDDGDTGCIFGIDGVTLTFTSHGICTLRATGERDYYEDWVAERILRVRPGAVGITAGAFSGSDILKVGGAAVAPTGTGNPIPSSAEVFWELVRGEKDCVLENPQTGSVSARVVPISDPPPVCSLQLVARKEGFDTYRSEPVTIPLAKGDMGDLTPPVYTEGLNSYLAIGASLDMLAAPTEENGLVLAVEEFAAAGFESDGTTSAANVCTVDDTGQVTAGSGATAGYKCVVTVTVSAVGYENGTAPVTLTVVAGELSFATDPVLSYTEELKIGVATGLVAVTTGLAGTDDNTVTVAWDYRVAGRDADGNSKDDVCEVEASSGIPLRATVTLAAASGGGGRVRCPCCRYGHRLCGCGGRPGGTDGCGRGFGVCFRHQSELFRSDVAHGGGASFQLFPTPRRTTTVWRCLGALGEWRGWMVRLSKADVCSVDENGQGGELVPPPERGTSAKFMP